MATTMKMVMSMKIMMMKSISKIYENIDQGRLLVTAGDPVEKVEVSGIIMSTILISWWVGWSRRSIIITIIVIIVIITITTIIVIIVIIVVIIILTRLVRGNIWRSSKQRCPTSLTR